MTTYGLRENVSYCFIDGRPLFLDTSADRYFRLSGEAESTFVAYAAGDACSRDDIRRLMQSGVLTNHAPSSTRADRHVPDAEDSLLEQQVSPDRYSPRIAFEALALTLVIRRKLRTCRLQVVLDELDALRSQTSTMENGDVHGRLTSQARSFLGARKLVPVASRCLLDSIAMATFLARRHVYVDIVFGVRDDPFSAHCWAQLGELVLNDTIGHIRSYTVIRVA